MAVPTPLSLGSMVSSSRERVVPNLSAISTVVPPPGLAQQPPLRLSLSLVHKLILRTSSSLDRLVGLSGLPEVLML